MAGQPEPCAAPGAAELPPGQRRAARWKASHYGRVPPLDARTWRLVLGGSTRGGGRTVLDLAALQGLPFTELDAPLHCVDRHTVPSIRWGGVPLAALLALEPPRDDAAHVLLAAARGYSSSLPLEELHHPQALLATHADGEPLTPEHGWPARVVLPHLYGFKGPKWVLEITFHREPQQGWWEERGYHPRGRADLEERWAHQG